MKVKIKRVEAGAQYEDTVFDFWIDMETDSGHILNVFDNKPFDLRNKEQYLVDVLLVADFISKENKKSEKHQIIEGKVIPVEFACQQGWLYITSDISQKTWYGLDTNNGLILLSNPDVEEIGFEVGKVVLLNVGRIDLVGVKY